MFDMKKMKLTGSREKIIASVAIIVLALIIFTKFIYLPHKDTLDKLKRDAESIDREISRIKTEASGGPSLEASIAILQKKLAELDNKFPQKEEMILRELPTLAQRAGVEIGSMTPGKKQMVRDVNQKPLTIEGYLIEEMNVSIEMRAPYRAIGEYIRILKEEFPVYTRVVNLSLSKDTASDLKGSLVVSFYLLAKK